MKNKYAKMASVASKKIYNKSDWRIVFAELKDLVQKNRSKVKTAA